MKKNINFRVRTEGTVEHLLWNFFVKIVYGYKVRVRVIFYLTSFILAIYL